MKGVVLLVDRVTVHLGHLASYMERLMSNVKVALTDAHGLRGVIGELINSGVDDLVIIHNDFPGINDLVSSVPRDVKVTVSSASPNVAWAYLASALLELLDQAPQALVGNLLRSIVALTGDPQLALSIAANFDLNSVHELIEGARLIVIDDLRILSFINTRNVKPGVKIKCSCGYGLSYTTDSIVVIGTYLNLVGDLIRGIRSGARPMLSIVTAPAINDKEASVKDELLSIDAPSIVTRGTKGGPHVGGLILDTLLGGH